MDVSLAANNDFDVRNSLALGVGRQPKWGPTGVFKDHFAGSAFNVTPVTASTVRCIYDVVVPLMILILTPEECNVGRWAGEDPPKSVWGEAPWQGRWWRSNVEVVGNR